MTVNENNIKIFKYAFFKNCISSIFCSSLKNIESKLVLYYRYVSRKFYLFYRHLDHLCTYVRWTVARDLICIESNIVKRGKDENSFFFFFIIMAIVMI